MIIKISDYGSDRSYSIVPGSPDSDVAFEVQKTVNHSQTTGSERLVLTDRLGRQRFIEVLYGKPSMESVHFDL